jgi:hypothetical protein
MILKRSLDLIIERLAGIAGEWQALEEGKKVIVSNWVVSLPLLPLRVLPS